MTDMEEIIEKANYNMEYAKNLLWIFTENYIDTADARSELLFDLEHRSETVVILIHAILYFIGEGKRWLEAYTDPTGAVVSLFFEEAETMKRIVGMSRNTPSGETKFENTED